MVLQEVLPQILTEKSINASQGDKLFVSKLDYKYDFITVGYSKFYDIRLTPKEKKRNVIKE